MSLADNKVPPLKNMQSLGDNDPELEKAKKRMPRNVSLTVTPLDGDDDLNASFQEDHEAFLSKRSSSEAGAESEAVEEIKNQNYESAHNSTNEVESRDVMPSALQNYVSSSSMDSESTGPLPGERRRPTVDVVDVSRTSTKFAKIEEMLAQHSQMMTQFIEEQRKVKKRTSVVEMPVRKVSKPAKANYSQTI